MEVKLLELKKKIISLKPGTEIFYGYDIARFFTGILNNYRYDKILYMDMDFIRCLLKKASKLNFW